MNGKGGSQFFPNLSKLIIMAGVTTIISVVLSAMLPLSSQLQSDASSGGVAFADSGAPLTAQSGSSFLQTQSGKFKASTYYLNLTPKVKKIPYGHKYIWTPKTVTVNIPNASYYPVSWRSSNPKVATCADAYKQTAMRLTVYGHAHGKSTITITNSATFETIRIKVVVNGCNSKDFRASKAKLDLSPKEKKISGGYKYTAKSSTLTVAAPDGAGVSWKSSDSHVATAEWSKKWVGNTTKLTITGHARGTATITLTNTKTKKKIKIKVTVGGYGLGFKWGNMEKKAGYWIDNVTLRNNTGKKVTLDKNCTFRAWAKEYW